MHFVDAASVTVLLAVRRGRDDVIFHGDVAFVENDDSFVVVVDDFFIGIGNHRLGRFDDVLDRFLSLCGARGTA